MHVPADAGGFFTHHGLWAPGVRLFRCLRFAAKAAIILGVCMLPLLGLLGWQLWAESEAAERARMDATRQHVEIADRKSTRLNSSHSQQSRMPSSA